ncbi:MAG: ATP-binding protein [Nitrospinaceae bacterium]
MAQVAYRKRGMDFALILGGILLSADVFGLDLLFPLGIAVAVPYAGTVLLGLLWPGPTYVLTAATGATVLTLLGFFLAPSEPELWKALLHRGLAVLVIWGVAGFCLSLKRSRSEKRELQNLIAHIGRVVSQPLTRPQDSPLFKNILDSLLSITQSRFGIIGEVLKDPEGKVHIENRAGSIRDDGPMESAGVFQESAPIYPEIEIYSMSHLLNEVLNTGKPLLIQYGAEDTRGARLVTGHPPLESFLGLPLYHEGKILAVVGIANRPEGYDDALLEYLNPFFSAAAYGIQLFRTGQEREKMQEACREGDEKLKQLRDELQKMELALEEKDGQIRQIQQERLKGEEALQAWEERLNRIQEELGWATRDFEARNDQIRQFESKLTHTEQALREREEEVSRVQAEKTGIQEELRDARERLAEMENQLSRSANELREKENLLAQLEDELHQAQNAALETGKRIGQLEKDQRQKEEALREKEDRLNEVQQELDRMEKILREKEEQESHAGEEKKRIERAMRENKEHLSRVHKELKRTAKALRNRVKGLSETKKEKSRIEEDLKKREKRLQEVEAHLKRVLEARGQAEKRFLEIAGTAREWFWEVDEDGLYTYSSPAVERILGYQPEEIVGKKHFYDLFDPSSREDLKRAFFKVIAQKEYLRDVSTTKQHKTGRPVDLKTTAAPILDEEGELRGYRGMNTEAPGREETVQEVSQTRKELEERVEERNLELSEMNQRLQKEIAERVRIKDTFRHYAQELERSNKDLKEFASIASHDLQDPLRKVIAFGKRLKQDCYESLDERGRDYLERMERATERMQNFIDDLLQYSKVSTKAPQLRQVDLNEVVEGVLVFLETRVAASGGRVSVDKLPTLEADRMQMHQLFQNLISNALKFHKEGRAPVVTIRHRSLEGGLHEIQVEDNGIGFDERHLERIFKPFERLHGTNQYNGSGMGLAICQKIVQLHGGDITAKSAKNAGSTFIITLPEKQAGRKSKKEPGENFPNL